MQINNFMDSQITDLGELKSIGGNAYFEGSQITSLGNLQSIRGNADFWGAHITDLGNLQSIGGNVYIAHSGLSEDDFASVEVGGKIYR